MKADLLLTISNEHWRRWPAVKGLFVVRGRSAMELDCGLVGGRSVSQPECCVTATVAVEGKGIDDLAVAARCMTQSLYSIYGISK
nr:hypothetical protein Itr_chr13CG15590 [Ipomoea trifida]